MFLATEAFLLRSSHQAAITLDGGGSIVTTQPISEAKDVYNWGLVGSMRNSDPNGPSLRRATLC